MALYLRKYWLNYPRGAVKYWGWWRYPVNWSWEDFKVACWNLDRPSEEWKAEAKRRYGPRDRVPPSEAELAKRERRNAGLDDTRYFSIRYEDAKMIIRGTTPYFLGDVMKARYEELEALYKLFPDDPLLLLHLQSYFGKDWWEIKEGLDRERADLIGPAPEE